MIVSYSRSKMTTLQRRSVLVTSFISARDYIVLLHNGIKKLSFENSFFIWGWGSSIYAMNKLLLFAVSKEKPSSEVQITSQFLRKNKRSLFESLIWFTRIDLGKVRKRVSGVSFACSGFPLSNQKGYRGLWRSKFWIGPTHDFWNSGVCLQG